MDNIDSLPTLENSDFTPDEESVLNTYFSDEDEDEEIKDNKINWKLFIILIILFALLASSILNGLFNKIPYVSKNEYTILIFKTFIFALVYLGLYYFM